MSACVSCGYWVATIGPQCETCYDTNVPIDPAASIPTPTEAEAHALYGSLWGEESETLGDHLSAKYGHAAGWAFFDRLYAAHGGGRQMLTAYILGEETP